MTLTDENWQLAIDLVSGCGAEQTLDAARVACSQ
jgi:hypothetical protein